VTAFDLAWAPPPSRCFTVSGGQFVAAERERERRNELKRTIRSAPSTQR
jgi:hypothetical protein